MLSFQSGKLINCTEELIQKVVSELMWSPEM